jgi:TPR repeat protein
MESVSMAIAKLAVMSRRLFRTDFAYLLCFMAIFITSHSYANEMIACAIGGPSKVESVSKIFGAEIKSGRFVDIVNNGNKRHYKYQIAKDGYPQNLVLLNSGRLLMVGDSCHRKLNYLALHDLSGKVVWEKNKNDFGFERRLFKETDADGIYRDTPEFIVEKNIQAYLVFRLYSENKIKIRLSDGYLEYINIPASSLKNDPGRLFNRAEALFRARQNTEAEALMLKVIQLDPKNYRAVEELARNYSQTKKYAQATLLWSNLAAHYPLNDDAVKDPSNHSRHIGKAFWVWSELGEAQVKEKRIKDARDTFNKILKLKPLDAEVVDLLSRTYLDEKNYSAARDLLLSYMKLSKGEELFFGFTEVTFLETIGEIFLRENRFTEAQKYFDLAVEKQIGNIISMDKNIDNRLADWVLNITERLVGTIRRYLDSGCKKCTDQQRAELNKLLLRYVEKGAEYSVGRQPENALKVANQYLISGDLQKAFYWYQKSVDIAESSKTPFSSRGFYSDPYFALCYFYREGEVVKQDYSKAFRYCKKSDEIGNRASSYWLGLIYASGKGVAQNEAMAIRLLEKAHQDNYPTGGSNPYAFSLEIPSKLPTKQWLWAEVVLKNLANKGDKTAQYFLGYMYLYGYGIDKDISQALFYLNASADQGVGDASLALGNFYKGER